MLGGGRFLLQSLKPFARPCHPRLEFAFLQHAGFVGIDQPTDASLERKSLLLNLIHIDVQLVVTTEATLKFLLKGLRVLHQGADICPNRSVQPVEPDGFVLTELGSTAARRVHAAAAIVRIGGLIVFRKPRDPFPIPGVTATAAHQQSLQQITWALCLLSIAFSVFDNLFGSRLKQFRTDDGGHRNDDLIFSGSRIA